MQACRLCSTGAPREGSRTNRSEVLKPTATCGKAPDDACDGSHAHSNLTCPSKRGGPLSHKKRPCQALGPGPSPVELKRWAKAASRRSKRKDVLTAVSADTRVSSSSRAFSDRICARVSTTNCARAENGAENSGSTNSTLSKWVWPKCKHSKRCRNDTHSAIKN